MNWLNPSLATLIVALLLSITLPATAADKWRIDDFGTRDPEKLLMQSWDSPSFGVKVRIRSYLAEKQADTPQGLFAQAWLLGLEQREAGSRAYERCIASHPRYQPCLYNLAADYTSEKKFEDALRLRQRLLDIDPAFNHKFVLYHAYSTLKHDLNRAADAAILLSRYRDRLGESHIWAYIESQDASKAKNPGLALEKLESAQRQDDAPFEVWEEIADLKSNELYDSRQGESRLDLAVAVMFDYLRAGHREPRPIAYLRDNFKSALAVSRERQKLIDIEKQLSQVMAPEFIQYAAFNDHDLNEAAEWVETNLPAPDGNEVPYELYAWADARVRVDGMTPRVISAYRRAITNAYTESERRKQYGALLNANSEGGWCTQVAALAAELEAKFPALKSPENTLEVAICNQDPTQAAKHLENYQAQSGPTYRADWGRIAKLRAAEQNRAQYRRDHPFLQNWFEQFGDRMELRIEFATASAELPASAQPELNKLAILLKSPAAAGYVFEISGHTDNRGSASFNETLSGARAESVVAAGMAWFR